MRYNLTPKQLAKFHASYTKGDGCWIWHKSKAWYGHGNFHFNATYAGAHRIMYAITHGEIPDGLIVRHKCDNPPCVNPEHLEIGTHQDNFADRDKRGRAAKGEKNGNVKLTQAQVDEIRATVGKRRDKVNGVHALAKRFGVTPTMVRLIVRRKYWKPSDGEGSRC